MPADYGQTFGNQVFCLRFCRKTGYGHICILGSVLNRCEFYETLLFFNANYTQFFHLYSGLMPKMLESSRILQMFTKINTLAEEMVDGLTN